MFAFANKNRYTNASNEELMNNFRSENWSKLGNGKRLAILQEVENRNATVQGRLPCTVKSSDSKDEYGCYYPNSNLIEVNVNDYIKNEKGERVNNNAYQVLDTIYHEGEHAHQTNCIQNQTVSPNGLHQTTRDMCQIENSGNNYKGVIKYDHCTCEIDSNNAALRNVIESREQFRDDPKFDEYLADREDYFENVSSLDMSEVRREQNSAIYQAYDNGDISLRTHDDMLAVVNGVDSNQPAFTEARQLLDTIRSERNDNLARDSKENLSRDYSANNRTTNEADNADLHEESMHLSADKRTAFSDIMNNDQQHNRSFESCRESFRSEIKDGSESQLRDVAPQRDAFRSSMSGEQPSSTVDSSSRNNSKGNGEGDGNSSRNGVKR